MELQNKSDWIQRHPSTKNIERIDAFFSGHGYDMHRHDTYAIGRTLEGVQSFKYRNSMKHSLPGGTIILHPDELHDGHAGTEIGFHYRMVYIQPSLIQKILGGKPLPFIDGGLSTDPRLYAASHVLLHSFECIHPLEEDDTIFDLAHAMATVAGVKSSRKYIDYRATELARIYLLDHLDHIVTLDELEQVSGQDRWRLSRDFRALFGTSPYRYTMLRRLELVRELIIKGIPLVQASLIAGFTDQSHMAKNFKKTYGRTPKHWLNVIKEIKRQNSF